MVYKTLDKYTPFVESASKWLKIHTDYDITPRHSLWDYRDTYDNSVNYICHNRKKYALGQFMRLTYPIFYEDVDGKTGVISGYDCTDYYKPYLIEIHPDGECARLFLEYYEED